MDENLNLVTETTGAEEPAVAEPVVEAGAEVQEVAEPVKSTSDAAFAEMRRAREAAEAALKAKESENARLMEGLGLFFDGKTADDKYAQAVAYHQNRSVEDVQKELQEQSRVDTLSHENEELKRQLQNVHVEKAMADDLRLIQTLDPTIKSLEELGQTYLELIAKGCDAETAYYGAQAKKAKEKITPPEPPGKVNSAPAEKDYYSKDEVANMSQEEVSKNYDKIRASMSKW